VVFEIAEEEIVFEIDGIVADVAFLDHVEDVGPDGGVIAFVFCKRFGFYLDDRTISFHGVGILSDLGANTSDRPKRLEF
jgi:hypothetical protein